MCLTVMITPDLKFSPQFGYMTEILYYVFHMYRSSTGLSLAQQVTISQLAWKLEPGYM